MTSPRATRCSSPGTRVSTSSTTRQLERDFAAATANDAYDGNVAENIAQYEADPTVEQLLHFVNADPNRTPSFTVFPKPDFFMSSGTSDTCPAGTTQATAAANCSFINKGFAWNHGYYAPEIDNTWLGLVGPGVAHSAHNGGVDGSTAGQGPSSAGTADSAPQLVTSLTNPGTWADHTDVRPTLMALTGLKDDYIDDGRVLTEDLTLRPGRTSNPLFVPLARCYKQLNSSVGRFGTDMLGADTAALKTGSATDDSTYQAVSSRIAALGSARDALATQIKGDLFNAEFNGGTLSRGGLELIGCTLLLHLADTMAP